MCNALVVNTLNVSILVNVWLHWHFTTHSVFCGLNLHDLLMANVCHVFQDFLFYDMLSFVVFFYWIIYQNLFYHYWWFYVAVVLGVYSNGGLCCRKSVFLPAGQFCYTKSLMFHILLYFLSVNLLHICIVILWFASHNTHCLLMYIVTIHILKSISQNELSVSKSSNFPNIYDGWVILIFVTVVLTIWTFDSYLGEDM